MSRSREHFDCVNCKWGRHCDESNPAQHPVWIIKETGIESRVCLLPLITPFSHQMISLYGHYKNSLMPFFGGVLEQPNIYLESMNLIDATISRLDAEKNGRK